MSLNIEAREASWFTGLGWTGPYAAAHEVPALWRDLAARLEELDPSARTGRFLGPCHARRSEFTVYAGVGTAAPIAVPPGMRSFLLMPQRYARFAHHGPMSRVTQTYSKAFAQLREQGVRRDLGTLWLELYDDRYLPFRDAPERDANAYEILLAIE